ncbi:MAG: hypothetical protein KIT58_06370 [Planctomycetota bacterium]|nr:hypothetical protein [Planctomycetota bacterium]
MLDTGMNALELERALAGAAILDDKVARMLLSELDLETIADPTARLALWAVRRGLEAADLVDDLDVPEGEPPPMTDVELIVEALDCAGVLEAAGGADAVAALVEDRPALRAALERGRAAVAAMAPVEQEWVVELARALLG